ncbi:MAG: ATP-dependent 6-phosphofructokinase [Clostridia bacterium]|nr:ATP-dependent 6-phosphofructokinase [Clostridia bacterium]
MAKAASGSKSKKANRAGGAIGESEMLDIEAGGADAPASEKGARALPPRRIGILTSGGDAPGMNAAVVAVARSAERHNMKLLGIKRGFNGLLFSDENKDACIEQLNLDTMLDIADQPGTYLRTARCEGFKLPECQRMAADNVRALGLDGLVIIGGDGSYQGALRLCQLGIPCIALPGTIDNDLKYTEMTLGYDTAVNCCVEAIRAIRATSRSHDRPAVVEVMGRHCGAIALNAAASTGSEIVVVPEVPWTVDQVADRLNAQIAKGNYRVTAVIAEGAYEDSMEPFDVYGFLNDFPGAPKRCYPGEPMTAVRLASILKRKCGMVEARATVLGYIQRGHQPSAYDAAFAFEAGHLAVKLLYDNFALLDGGAEIENYAIGIRKGRIFHISIEEALRKKRRFNKKVYKLINHQQE